MNESSPPGEREIEFTGEELLKLEGGLYLWIAIKRFHLPAAETSPLEALGLLIRHPQYRDHYISPDSQSDTGTAHGPYLLSSISVESFDPVRTADATAVLDGFLSLYGGPGEEGAAGIRAQIQPLLDAATQVYRLRDLGSDAHHDAGWVLDDYNELVSVDLPGRSLTLLVAAGD